MPKLDEAKERLGLLKFWLGIIVGSFLANVAWLATNYTKTDSLIMIGSILVIVGLIIAFVIISRKIEVKLKEIGDIKK
ncbi:hypothetical protein [Campylobacter fetus]|uniref:hypothetical protein n=3 Tax=Campylobacter fetus TaxID=196 RepID=UPI0008189DD5|nr:hypothetical protein [Campylobacter fetus]OCR93110.1 hypothetical protein CFT12S02842_08855 [Campylobacter fetus subsp. testudinum]OCR96274.1 hypothetical protein CFT12S02855_08630 [Campylobacter fetus subsp. testudinum]OCR98604.1 hypothetical protein A9K75_09930 [Campylobacter fetus subsp. testudinum]OCS10559.1 hypothetical protein CFTD6690_08870 [Campylobacter fetus subsp. testudinum]OCS12695.1 hypothetical protein CFTD6856_08615 [Campylobacter fetus subsp. testudinum]